MFIDSHAHLEMGEFDRDRDMVIRRASEAGVGRICTVGTSLPDCRKAIEIASRYSNVYAIVGIHPHEAKDIEPATYVELKALARQSKVIAYGEIGLDFFRDISPRQVQLRCFGEQLDIASELGLPIVIHDREAHRETLEMLRAWTGGRRGVIHCFSGDYAMARECLDLGFYLSIPGTITYKKSDSLAQVVKKIPLDRLLIETDAPYLAPVPHRGKRNEPAYVVLTARRIAEIRALESEEVARATTDNARRIFGIDEGLDTSQG